MKKKYVKPRAKVCLPDWDMHLLAGSDPEPLKIEYTEEEADLGNEIL